MGRLHARQPLHSHTAAMTFLKLAQQALQPGQGPPTCAASNHLRYKAGRLDGRDAIARPAPGPFYAAVGHMTRGAGILTWAWPPPPLAQATAPFRRDLGKNRGLPLRRALALQAGELVPDMRWPPDEHHLKRMSRQTGRAGFVGGQHRKESDNGRSQRMKSRLLPKLQSGPSSPSRIPPMPPPVTFRPPG